MMYTDSAVSEQRIPAVRGQSGGDAGSTIYWKPVDCPVRKELTTVRHHELISVRQYVQCADKNGY